MQLPPLPAGTHWGSFPTTADTGLWARSSTLDGLFTGLGTGLFAAMTDLRRVTPREVRSVRTRGAGVSELVVAFLSELIVLEDSERFVARRVAAHVTRGAQSVTARAYGEPWDAARHERRKEVKAVTMHRLRVSASPPRARVILDI
ncbi:MAG: archease [Thermoplasmata archaeon]|nr:archease [Thermoplasmata archaeon]MCI4356179.1 archease [Thermoplasmata archaeon]